MRRGLREVERISSAPAYRTSAISSASDTQLRRSSAGCWAALGRELAEFSRSAAGESWPQGVRRVLSQGGQGSGLGRERGAGAPVVRR
jgi:hypothetical protein